MFFFFLFCLEQIYFFQLFILILSNYRKVSHFLVNQETISIPNVGVNITIDSNFIEVNNNQASFDHDYASNIMLSSLKLPFGLSLKHYPHIKAMLQEDPLLISTANIMVKPHLADALIKN